MTRRRLAVVGRVLVFAIVGSLIVFAEPATALTVPKTLADQRPVQRGPMEPGFPIDYVGVLWDVEHGHHHHDGDDEGPEPHGAVRFRHDGVWTAWQPLIEDGVQAEGRWLSGLVSGGDAEAYQVRGVPAEAVSARAAAINTTDGPQVRIGEARGGSAGALASTQCQSRADWGADEELRFDATGNEIWPPTHHPVQVLTVHHTATKNNDPDPEATVRAIYRYHAVDNGWGDIGYQYLIDESGVVYEGRWSGTASASCETANGDGSEFGHEAADADADADGVLDEMTTGAHTGGANSGNMGIALLGEFTDHPRTGGDPKVAAVSSLEDVLAELAVRHALDPTKLDVLYVNPVDGSTKTVPTISGHRDWNATECPGKRLYGQLPTIRQNVAAKMAAGPADNPPAVSVTNPPDGATVSGSITVTADANDTDGGVTQVEFFIDDLSIGVDTDGFDGWSAPWATTNSTEGGHTAHAVATDTALQTTTSSAINVTVDNDPDQAAVIHVADLSGSAQSNRNRWGATVTITVRDDAGNPVDDATVAGTWSHTTTAASCITGTSGTCEVTSGWVPRSTSSVTFTVADVSASNATYNPGQNVESSITVTKPS